MSQANLMTQRRFAPFFWTSFLTAFNDNVLKGGMVAYVVAKSLSVYGFDTNLLVAFATVIIMIPFIFLSASAGQVMDKYSKSRGIFWVKCTEIGAMAVGLWGLWAGSVEVLLLALFLTGLQSTFFGPAQYSMLPEVLEESELVGGNALIEAGTFLSILLGGILGGGIISYFGPEQGAMILGGAIVGFALLGVATAAFIPPVEAADPDLKVDLNPVTPNIPIFRETMKNRSVFLSIMGLAWFWFIGSAILAFIPAYVESWIPGDQVNGLIFFQALFSVGIGLGSLFCERLSRGHIEVGLVPFGSFGMALFIFDLFVVGSPLSGQASETVGAFLRTGVGLRICFDMFMIAAFGGLFTVPLYAVIQADTRKEVRSRVIAGMNIITSLFILLGGAAVMGFVGVGLDHGLVFLSLAVLHMLVSLYIYHLLPKFMWRFVVWLVTNVAYRVTYTGLENIPDEGPVLLTCNHPSYIDFMFVASASRRPPHFVMYYGFFDMPVVRWLFREADVIPIAPKKEDPKVLQEAYDKIADALERGEVVCIFPEGDLTYDGKLAAFKPGLERIVKRTPVPVVPIALKGMWGSFFSRFHGKALSKPFRRFWSKTEIVIGEAMDPENIKAHRVAEETARLGEFEVPEALY